ncbi:MAG: hypothetical protein RL681_804 [Candidatus Parcubacteria bacterium]
MHRAAKSSEQISPGHVNGLMSVFWQPWGRRVDPIMLNRPEAKVYARCSWWHHNYYRRRKKPRCRMAPGFDIFQKTVHYRYFVMKNKGTVFVGMSGGVDSSVAAYLLKREGYDVIGVFMRCYNIDGCAEQDAEDARRVAGHLGIPFYVWDFEEEYKKRVVQYMVDGYRHGLTPNPDVECNREIKFGLFFDRARSLGADFVATGHYVRLRRGMLCAAKDANKDQSYFLWTLTQRELAHCRFPIGEYTKPQVRAIARRANLPTADKKDSQGVCFLGNVAVKDFLKRYIKPKQGRIVTADGTVVGRHEGAYFYTIGQRHGLDLKEKNAALRIRGEHRTRPHYVAAKDVKKNILIVAEGENNSALYQKDVALGGVNFIDPHHSKILKDGGMSVLARVRYRQPLSPAKLRALGRGRYRLAFAKPQKFVAPGQSAVFYLPGHSGGKAGLKSELRVLGGGIIL